MPRKTFNELQDDGPLVVKVAGKRAAIAARYADPVKEPTSFWRFTALCFAVAFGLSTLLLVFAMLMLTGKDATAATFALIFFGGGLVGGVYIWQLVLPAWILERKGYGSNERAAITIGALFFWLVMIIVAIIVPPRNEAR